MWPLRNFRPTLTLEPGLPQPWRMPDPPSGQCPHKSLTPAGREAPPPRKILLGHTLGRAAPWLRPRPDGEVRNASHGWPRPARTSRSLLRSPLRGPRGGRPERGGARRWRDPPAPLPPALLRCSAAIGLALQALWILRRARSRDRRGPNPARCAPGPDGGRRRLPEPLGPPLQRPAKRLEPAVRTRAQRIA